MGRSRNAGCELPVKRNLIGSSAVKSSKKSQILTINRKYSILRYRRKWLAELNCSSRMEMEKALRTSSWRKDLSQYLGSIDDEINVTDVKRWISVHPWITDPGIIPKGLSESEFQQITKVKIQATPKSGRGHSSSDTVTRAQTVQGKTSETSRRPFAKTSEPNNDELPILTPHNTPIRIPPSNSESEPMDTPHIGAVEPHFKKRILYTISSIPVASNSDSGGLTNEDNSSGDIPVTNNNDLHRERSPMPSAKTTAEYPTSSSIQPNAQVACTPERLADSVNPEWQDDAEEPISNVHGRTATEGNGPPQEVHDRFRQTSSDVGVYGDTVFTVNNDVSQEPINRYAETDWENDTEEHASNVHGRSATQGDGPELNENSVNGPVPPQNTHGQFNPISADVEVYGETVFTVNNDDRQQPTNRYAERTGYQPIPNMYYNTQPSTPNRWASGVTHPCHPDCQKCARELSFSSHGLITMEANGVESNGNNSTGMTVPQRYHGFFDTESSNGYEYGGAPSNEMHQQPSPYEYAETTGYRSFTNIRQNVPPMFNADQWTPTSANEFDLNGRTFPQASNVIENGNNGPGVFQLQNVRSHELPQTISTSHPGQDPAMSPKPSANLQKLSEIMERIKKDGFLRNNPWDRTSKFGNRPINPPESSFRIKYILNGMLQVCNEYGDGLFNVTHMVREISKCKRVFDRIMRKILLPVSFHDALKRNQALISQQMKDEHSGAPEPGMTYAHHEAEAFNESSMDSQFSGEFPLANNQQHLPQQYQMTQPQPHTNYDNGPSQIIPLSKTP